MLHLPDDIVLLILSHAVWFDKLHLSFCSKQMQKLYCKCKIIYSLSRHCNAYLHHDKLMLSSRFVLPHRRFLKDDWIHRNVIRDESYNHRGTVSFSSPMPFSDGFYSDNDILGNQQYLTVSGCQVHLNHGRLKISRGGVCQFREYHVKAMQKCGSHAIAFETSTTKDRILVFIRQWDIVKMKLPRSSVVVRCRSENVYVQNSDKRLLRVSLGCTEFVSRIDHRLRENASFYDDNRCILMSWKITACLEVQIMHVLHERTRLTIYLNDMCMLRDIFFWGDTLVMASYGGRVHYLNFVDKKTESVPEVCMCRDHVPTKYSFSSSRKKKDHT